MHNKTKVKSAIILTFFMLFSIGCAHFSIANFCPSRYHVRGTSMFPTIQNDQHVWIDKKFETLERGEIIIFRYQHKHFIKRIIGIPGDSIEIYDYGIIVNGQLLHEPYLYKDFVYAQQSFEVPDNYYFVLGDNRDVSCDSRNIGYVKLQDVVGYVFWR